MAVTKQTVQAAGEELGNLVCLLIDGTPNREQIVQFATEGFQAVQALAAIGIPTSNREAVVTNLVEGILRRVNEKQFVLS
jgi:hypothetical protein